MKEKKESDLGMSQMGKNTPKIRETAAGTFFEEIKRKAQFYVPEWTPGIKGDFGSTLSCIFANMAENIAINLNDAPRKHFLSFLNMLDFSLRPAKPARTVLCFILGSGAPENVIIPERTRVTAEGPKGEDIFFETEKTIAATPSKLCYICSSEKERDTIFDHSSIIGGTSPSILFSGKNLQEHVFYLGDKELFAIGKGKINLSLKTVSSAPASLLAEKSLFIWEYTAPESEENKESLIINEWVPFSDVRFSGGKLVIQKDKGVIGKGKINGIESQWIRCCLKDDKFLEMEHFSIDSVKVDTSAEGIMPDILFYNDIPLEDEGMGVQPFGSKPLLYDTFYIACSEVFSRRGCEVWMEFYLEPGMTGLLSEKPVLSWEYWNGESWRSLKKFMDIRVNLEESEERIKEFEKENEYEKETEFEEEPLDLELENFLINEIKQTKAENESNLINIVFSVEESENDENPPIVPVIVKIREVPPMMPGNVNGEENYWIRIRLIEGNFGKEYVITKKNVIEPGKFYPPKIRNLLFNYLDRDGKEPEYLVLENSLTFEDKSKELRLQGSFNPFKTISESLPAVYFGFNSKLVKGPLSLYFKLEETFVEKSSVKFKWQYLSFARDINSGEKEGAWNELQFLDETIGLAKSGILEIFVPGEMKAFQTYGSKSPLYWIRLLFTEGKRAPKISGLYSNCVWALQARTIEDEILGSSLKKLGQEFKFMNKPVVDAEVWVNEVSWLPEVEKQSLLKNRIGNVKATTDDQGSFSEFWVRWEEVVDFSNSDEKSRHYLLDRTSGEIRFGNGIKGMIPPVGINNIKSSYRTGGGEAGNFEAFSITKLYSSLKYIDNVYNPVSSEGGSETENLEELVERAPATFKHRNRAVSGEDITYLTKEAYEKVTKVKVLSGSDEEEKNAPGLITVVVLPDFPGSRPAPTAEIIQIVEAYLNERAPNVGRLKVVGPLYYQVNVKALLVSTDLEAVSEVESRVRTGIEQFLHPLKGGKEGNGWNFGQIPSISSFHFLLSDINGISYIEKIDITLKDENGSLVELSKLPKRAMPCNGKHEISVLWKAEGEE
jgi:hypothetical protein